MHANPHALLVTIVVAVFLGILAQVLAHRLKLPAILPLLLLGMTAGPFAFKLFDPAVLGGVLEVFIHIGVAIILFEGSLSLDLRQLRQVGGSVRNLLTIGVVVTWVLATWLVSWLTEAPLATALLFGAIVTVTGPTVIAPLLRHMVAPRRVRTILISEGLMIDPIGAVLAYFVLQWVEFAGLELRPLLIELLKLFGYGAVFGFVAGSAAKFVARHRHTAGELRNLSILALLLGSYLVAESQAPQSGIVAAVAMGLTMSATRIPDLVPVKEFKGQLTVLLISVLFILLSGQLDLGAMLRLGTSGLWVALGLVLLVRPLAILASVLPPSQLTWKEKVLLGMTAPRGIVAAAVASLSAIQLRERGFSEGAAMLEGLVYLTILVTCTWATLMAVVLPRLLGYHEDPSRRLIVLVGANALTRNLALVFRRHGWIAVVVDSVEAKIRPLTEHKIQTVHGDARDASTYESAGVERDSFVIAATTNDELNLLVAAMVRDEFGVEHPVVVLQRQSEEFGNLRQAWVDVLGGRDLDLVRWERRLEQQEAELRTLEMRRDPVTAATLEVLLREHRKGCRLLCGWQGGQPIFRPDLAKLENLDQATLLIERTLAQANFPAAAVEEVTKEEAEPALPDAPATMS